LKVLLISNPPSHLQKPDFPPVGIACLGAISHLAGHDTLLIDSGFFQISDIVNQAYRFGPDVIGITCWTIDRGRVWELCHELKKKIPSVFLVLGGPHASIYPEHVFLKTCAEAVVVGEGEQTFQELLTALKKNHDLKGIPGLALRGPDNAVLNFPTRGFIQNLDDLPLPFYQGFSQFSFSRYSGFAALPSPTAAIISSRGCIFDCTYCGSTQFWGRKWRYRSANNILKEIEWLKDVYKVRSLYFFDDNFLVNRQRISTLCEEIIRQNWNISWSCCSHVKMVNRELLDLMHRSGCVSIDFGVESGSDIILENINKKQTRKDIEKAFALVHQAGIKPRAYLMVGNKGETIDTIDETIDMAATINPHSSIGASLLWLLPGTRVFNEACENGFIDHQYWIRSNDVPYNLQEHTYKELFDLRQRLMIGIARQKVGFAPIISFYLKSVYYRYPSLSIMRSLIPDWLK
jgi:anaerobic magnesium-protoporphyrin IX monomethyl ester cyclase